MNNKEILLGDNQFFGVDNLSQERAKQRSDLFSKYENIVEMMDFVSNLGVKGFVVTTHPELKDIIRYMKKNSDLLKKFEFYPIFPHAQRYVSLSSEKGMFKAINEIISGGSTQQKLKIIFKGSVGFLKKDFKKLLQTVIDAELMTFNDVKKKSVFLHDGLTDLAVGLDMKELIQTFSSYVKDKYDLEVGLVTKNFPKIIETFEKWNLKPPTIMTSFNPIGYQMNPTKEECEKNLGKTRVFAINSLAGGYLRPQESFKYISKLDIDSVVIGMSSKKHAIETITAFKELVN